MTDLDRQPGEAVEDHIQRILTHWLFLGSTDADVAEMCDVSPQRVRRVRREMERMETIRRLYVHGRDVASEAFPEETPATVIHRALDALREAHRRGNGQTNHGPPAGPENGRRGSRGGTRDAGRSQDVRALTRQGDGQTGEAGTPQPSSRCAASGGST